LLRLIAGVTQLLIRWAMTARSLQSRQSSSVVMAAALCGLCLFASRNGASSGQPSGQGVCAPSDARAEMMSMPDSRRESSSAALMADSASIDAAIEFLKAQMDRYHRSTIVYAEDGLGAYYPSGKMGDVDDISVGLPRGGDHAGGTSLQIDYHPRHSGGLGWAGIHFLYPDGNWGQFPGRNLTGATRLTFLACADHHTRAEFSVGGVRDPGLPYFDTLPKVSTGIVAVTPTWQHYEIDLKGRDLSSVIGGFAVATSRDLDPDPRSLFLDDVAIDLSRLDEPRFLPSNLPRGICEVGVLHNSAQIYDQALVLLAFLARGQPDDLRRAELLARALVEARRRDRTFKDERLRNAYAGGELIDQHLGTTRFPVAYDPTTHAFVEDEDAVGTDSGNMAWAALALVEAHALLPKRAGDPYLSAAASLARWVVANTRVEDPLGGFSAGVQGFERAAAVPEGQERKDYRATEHNIDLEALFERLATALAGEPEESRHWSAQMTHARSFVDKMRAGGSDTFYYYWTGTAAGAGVRINKSVVPLDVQTWSVLGAREPGHHAGALDWALKNCTESGSRDAFDFNCNDGDGAWWEGTAQVAAALRWLKRDEEAAPMLARLRAAQLTDKPAAGALPAASRCGLTTGFTKTFHNGKTMPWLYTNWPHIGATAWFIFAALGANPYFVDGTAARAQ
jgi:hypothetical protein